ncbi:MAG: glycosyltransferase family 2 protein [Acidimicrobiales bacterium]
MTAPAPDITVVLCTYNRAERIERAVRAVLGQQGCDLELVVVDDGSTDATPKVLAGIDDDRLRVIRRPNGGLSRARNSGLAAAHGRWVVFLDDDDEAEPGWLATLLSPSDDPTVGISCCGCSFVDVDGNLLHTHLPKSLGELFDDVRGMWLAGTFAARSDLVRRCGGYLPGLGARHQTELFLRLVPAARAAGLGIATSDVLGVRIEGRPPTERPGVNPRRLYDATRWILARHAEAFAGRRSTVALYESVVGTAAARLGDWRSARRHFVRSARAMPRSPKLWGRVALASVPAVGGWVWNRHGAFASHDTSEVGVLRQDGDDIGPDRELFLPWHYRENTPPGPEGTAGGDGPGGTPLLERADDPVDVLRRLAATSAGGSIVVSTPDRAMTDSDRPLGPPSNAAHRREWTYEEFELLLLSTGFDVERSRYTDARMVFTLRVRGR